MGYWKTKVLPKIKKVFEKNSIKKAAAAEACKGFDDSKEEINKVFEEKKVELEPKVVEIYQSSSTEIKTLVKDRTDAGVKKHSVLVTKFIEELVKIEFPGSKIVSETSSQFGPALTSGPVLFLFEKVSTLIPVEETPAPAPAPAAEEVTTKEKELVVEEEKKEGEVEKVEEEVTPPSTSTTTTAEEPAATETPAAAEAAAEPVKAAAEAPKA